MQQIKQLLKALVLPIVRVYLYFKERRLDTAVMHHFVNCLDSRARLSKAKQQEMNITGGLVYHNEFDVFKDFTNQLFYKSTTGEWLFLGEGKKAYLDQLVHVEKQLRRSRTNLAELLTDQDPILRVYAEIRGKELYESN